MVQASRFFDWNSEMLHSAGVPLFDSNSEKEFKHHKINKLLFDQKGFPVHLANLLSLPCVEIPTQVKMPCFIKCHPLNPEMQLS
jgi:hypothetical protein